MLKGFKDLPGPAKKLILYYSLSSPLLITWTVFPIYLFKLGLTVIDIGAFFTLSFAIEALLTVAVGFLIDTKLNAKKVLISLEIIGSFTNMIYSFAKRKIEILSGMIIERVGSIFSVVFGVYEKALYPEDMRESAFSYHMALPNIMTVIFYPAIGLVLLSLSDTISAYRALYLMASIGSLMLTFYIYKFLPDIPSSVSFKKIKQKGSWKILSENRKLILISIGEISVVLGFSMAPSFILANYLYNVLGFSVFFFIMVEVVSSIFSAIASFLSTKFTKVHRFKVIYSSLAMLLIYSVLIYISNIFYHGVFSLLIIFLAVAIGEFGNTFQIIFGRSYLFDYVPDDYKGTVLGLISSTIRVSVVFLPLIAGLIAYNIGPLTPYLVSSMFFIISFAAYFLSSKVP